MEMKPEMLYIDLKDLDISPSLFKKIPDSLKNVCMNRKSKI